MRPTQEHPPILGIPFIHVNPQPYPHILGLGLPILYIRYFPLAFNGTLAVGCTRATDREGTAFAEAQKSRHGRVQVVL